jgi:hypothetical protein
VLDPVADRLRRHMELGRELRDREQS